MFKTKLYKNHLNFTLFGIEICCVGHVLELVKNVAKASYFLHTRSQFSKVVQSLNFKQLKVEGYYFGTILPTFNVWLLL